MVTLKEIKGGKLALIVEKEQAHVALQIFSTLLTHAEQLPTTATSKLDSVRHRVESVKEDVKISLRKALPAVKDVTNLGEEKAGNEISALLFTKIEETFGKAIPVYFRPFYTELEQHTGAPISGRHKLIAENPVGDKRKYPNRKIDTAIKLLGADKVYDFAKRYEFRGVAK